MEYKILKRMLRHLHLKETWVIFFILGIIMMNYPFIHIFYTPSTIFGIPALFIYLYIGWLVSISVIYLFVKAIGLEHEDKGEKN
jgi:hypothetical protein